MMTEKELKNEKQGTHGGVIIMGIIALISCAITDGGLGFYLTVGFFTAINAVAFYIEVMNDG